MEHEGKHVAMSVKTENKKIVSVKPYSADKETYDSFCVFCKNAFVEKSEARVKQILNND